MTYLLIDTDNQTIISSGKTEAEALEGMDLLPGDVVEGAETWAEAVAAASEYDGGINDLLECWRVVRAEDWETPTISAKDSTHSADAGDWVTYWADGQHSMHLGTGATPEEAEADARVVATEVGADISAGALTTYLVVAD